MKNNEDNDDKFENLNDEIEEYNDNFEDGFEDDYEDTISVDDFSADLQVDTFLDAIGDNILGDVKDKNRYRSWMVIGSSAFFIVITILVFVIVFNRHYSDNLKYILVFGVFITFISLLTIIYKYLFSSPKEYFDFAKQLLEWNYIKHKDDKNKE